MVRSETLSGGQRDLSCTTDAFRARGLGFRGRRGRGGARINRGEIWGRWRTRTIGASAVDQEIEFGRDRSCGISFGPSRLKARHSASASAVSATPRCLVQPERWRTTRSDWLAGVVCKCACSSVGAHLRIKTPAIPPRDVLRERKAGACRGAIAPRCAAHFDFVD